MPIGLGLDRPHCLRDCLGSLIAGRGSLDDIVIALHRFYGSRKENELAMGLEDGQSWLNRVLRFDRPGDRSSLGFLAVEFVVQTLKHPRRRQQFLKGWAIEDKPLARARSDTRFRGCCRRDFRHNAPNNGVGCPPDHPYRIDDNTPDLPRRATEIGFYGRWETF